MIRRRPRAIALYCILTRSLPMTWQAAAAFLACARIGAIHSAVFAGFSAESLRDRVDDCQSRVLITTDEGKRGGKTIATKASTCFRSARRKLLAWRFPFEGPRRPGIARWWARPLPLIQMHADAQQSSTPRSRNAPLSNTSSSSAGPAAGST